MFRIKILEEAVVFLLEKIAEAVGHLGIPGKFGIAIIIITILMRIKMRELQPERDKKKEKYKDDPQEYQKRTAEIYKANNVNPLGGCLPLLIQLPVFVALYYAFSGKTIPNDATFLWFNLKQPDRLFMFGNFAFNLLPILNTGVTYLQQKIMSGATDVYNASYDAVPFLQNAFRGNIILFSFRSSFACTTVYHYERKK